MLADDTIAALATPAGPGGISILRISGPRAWTITQAVFRPLGPLTLDPGPPVRTLTLGYAIDPSSGERLDQVFCVFFKGPRSYTGEDSAEIQGHAGPVVGRRILDALLAQGCRLARPGEFTSRAFLGGRIDLSQAEAVGRLVGALSDSQARLALASLQGGLGQSLAPVRSALLNAAASVEAAIDFPEDELDLDLKEVGIGLEAEIPSRLNKLIAGHQKRRIYQDGAVVVICGRANVGKSSLFNALLGSDRAIVTELPGTTRDVLAESILLDGVACRLVDTAGLGQARDIIEGMGQKRTKDALGSADLALVVLDGSRSLGAEDQEALELTAALPRIIVANKSDLIPCLDHGELAAGGSEVVKVSALSGDGLDGLIQAAGRILTGEEPEPEPGEFAANARQAEALSRCLTAVDRAASGLALKNPEVELISLELAAALAALSEVDGLGAPDEVIEAVFSNFCVGK